MLTQDRVVGYLLQRGLLGRDDVVDGDLVIRDASSRNRNFKVERRSDRSYMLKQGIGAEGAATVAHEAAMYEMLSGVGAPLQEYVPRLFGFDAEAGVLVVELVAGGEDLRRYHLRRGRIPESLAAAMGAAVGRLHRLTAGSPGRQSPAHAPWVLAVHRPDVTVFRQASSATLDLIKIVQAEDGFGSLLDELRDEWRLDTMIHHDLKWDNFIAVATSNSGAPVQVKLVDWETAMYGDPCWDLGSLFSHFLSTWLFSIPVTGMTPPERFPELAGYSLSAMFPAIGACWDAYRTEVGSDLAGGKVLRRATRLAGARLVQTAYETTQMSMSVTSSVMLHLQLAVNILRRPDDALTHLLGLTCLVDA